MIYIYTYALTTLIFLNTQVLLMESVCEVLGAPLSSPGMSSLGLHTFEVRPSLRVRG